MVIRHFFIILTCVVYFSGLTFANEELRAFSNMNIQQAKEKASLEGKLILLDFHANWCSPCKWMDQTTFADSDIISILREDYIALKIDIDNKDGYEIKNQFDVKYLPTLLIFNSEGIMIERVEKTITPRALKELLLAHNAPVNKKVVKHGINSSPSLSAPTNIESKKVQEIALSQDEEKEYTERPKLYKVYKLQVGVFGKYESAEAYIKQLNSAFTEPVTVTNEMVDGKMVFKVCIGQFESADEAYNFRKILKEDKNIDSFVQ